MTTNSEQVQVYDCFIYDGEECLDLRLRAHWDKVDWFVIAEANITHSGQSKEYMYQPSRYEWAKSKIRYIQLDKSDFAGCQTPRDREACQREALKAGLIDANPEDTVIVSDVDEILTPAAIGRVESGTVQFFEQLMMYFYADYMCISEPIWHRACAVTAAFAKDHSIDDIRMIKVFANMKRVMIPNAGWHFSYLGGPRVTTTKVERFIHQEFNKDKYKNPENNYQRMLKGKDVFRRSRRWGRVSNYHQGYAVIKDWFESRPEYFAPSDAVYFGDASDVVSTYKARSIIVRKFKKICLGIWNKFSP